MSALAGYDAEDPSTLTEHFDEPMIDRGIEGLRIGIAPDLHLTPLAPDHEKIFSHVVDTATSIAGTVNEVHIPHADEIRPAFTVIQLSESHHVHASELGIYPSRASEYGPDVIERLEMARRVTLSEYLSAVEQVRWIRRRFQIALQQADVILTPVYAGGPSRVADPGFSIHRGERIPFREVVMNYTVPQDLTGLPAASIRAGFDDDGIPVGVQATASWGNEEVALRVAAALQVALGEDAKTWPHLLPKEA
jgi:aspartyl-tRNA(Asn)/glutamyl-tRNA(Gln) amidotransferase subunit A